MVSWKGAAAVLLVLVALVGYLVTTSSHRPSSSAPPGMLPCAPGMVVDLRVAASDGRVMEARRADPLQPWQLVLPAARAGDGATLDGLVNAAAELAPTDTLKSPPPDSQLGLAPPGLTVACTLAGGGSYTLVVGGQNFDGNGSYARVGTGAKVYVIPSATVERFRKVLDQPPVAPSPSPSGGPSPSPST